MTTTRLHAELSELTFATYRLKAALERGDYKTACVELDTATAHNDGVAEAIGRLRAEVNCRDLAPELQASIDAVKGEKE